MPAFSVCIPNFNYERYLGATLQSVLDQDEGNFEVLISDNASTDGSVELVRRLQADPRLRLRVNRCNVGFFGNLSRAAEMAAGRFMLMLSSDDLMEPNALSSYRRLFEALGEAAGRSVISSATTIIDAHGATTGEQHIDWKQWRGAHKDQRLSDLLKADVYSMPALALLRRSLELLRTPFYFLSTAYPKVLHDAVEGYSQGGLINPDKRFAWALLGEAETAYFVDKPLFRYRWHAGNQTAQQSASGALKHLVDQYTATFTVPDALLDRAGVERRALARAFVEQDIALRGFKTFAAGQRLLARRMLAFGDAAYPAEMRSNSKVGILRMALATGPLGARVARAAMGPMERRWSRRMSQAGDGDSP